MDLADGARMDVVRRLTPELQREVDRLADIAAAVDGVRAFGEHKWLRLVRGDDRCTALLMWDGARLLGAAHCDAFHTRAPDRPCRMTAELVVHPDYRGHGFGRRLLHGVVDLACEQVAQEIHLWAYGNLPRARRLAHAFDYRPERRLLQYRLAPERLPPPPILPEHLRPRAFVPDRDAGKWLALHNRVFAGHPEQADWDAADLAARMQQPWFAGADLLMLEDRRSGQLVGFCWVKLPVDTSSPGEIYIVGVEPAVRGHGLGPLLTRVGLAHIAARGRPGAILYVEAANAAAVTMYERLGFVREWEHACYRQTLAA